MNRTEAEKAARELRIKIHNLNGKGDECMSPTNEANAKWLDFVVKEDADIIERAGGQDAAKEVGVREVAATAYQICGALEAPARILDYFSAVASGEAAENPLPFTPERPCGETAWVSELLAATKMMCESLPLYSPSSAAFTRKGRLDAAIKAAEKFCAGGSLKSAIGVKADLEHPGNDTGGESAESLLPSPPTAEAQCKTKR